MKNFKKGFIWLVILMVVIIFLAVVGILYYMGQNSSLLSSNFIKDFFPQENQIVNNTQQKESCLVITSPFANQTISFPLDIEGYIDLKSKTCTPWRSFEGEAGFISVVDKNGDGKSEAVIMKTEGDYYTGMEKWPVKATIPNLTKTSLVNQIFLKMSSPVVADTDVSVSNVVGPFTINSQQTILRKEGETCGEGIGSCGMGLGCFYPCGIPGCQNVCAKEGTLPRP